MGKIIHLDRYVRVPATYQHAIVIAISHSQPDFPGPGLRINHPKNVIRFDPRGKPCRYCGNENVGIVSGLCTVQESAKGQIG